MAQKSRANADTDEVKRKFREALDRKNQQRSPSSSHLDGHSKALTTHGNESHQRQFRRKSG
ncbi:DUF5302 domain-containing protein [Nocardia brevicatena]|uniref:DUF5302 domain-containing protein n=1 Tax=Nocardia brevicatena TaxID=37327 RepID=UPI0002DA5B7B|nr:DUF5302 domain-containing protein [Nocardia brevicatena]